MAALAYYSPILLMQHATPPFPDRVDSNNYYPIVEMRELRPSKGSDLSEVPRLHGTRCRKHWESLVHRSTSSPIHPSRPNVGEILGSTLFLARASDSKQGSWMLPPCVPGLSREWGPPGNDRLVAAPLIAFAQRLAKWESIPASEQTESAVAQTHSIRKMVRSSREGIQRVSPYPVCPALPTCTHSLQGRVRTESSPSWRELQLVSCYGFVSFDFPKRYPNPQYPSCGPIWRQGHYTCNPVKMTSLGWALI